MNKVLTSFLMILLCAPLLSQDGVQVIPDEEYRLACGPIAGLVALESLGVATDLPEIATRCQLSFHPLRCSFWNNDPEISTNPFQRTERVYLTGI